MPEQKEEECTNFDAILRPINHARRIGVIAVMAFAALLSYLGLWNIIGLPFDLIGLVATLVGGWPVWMEAWGAIRERHINMEITMALGVVAALAIGQFATAAIVVTFTLFSMYLEDLTKSQGKHALEALMRAAPDTAHVYRTGTLVEVKVEDVREGEQVLVRPGEKVPVDGKVLAGRSSVMEAAITGEPFPQEKHDGSPLFAGTINGSGALEMLATRTGKDTTYARIVALVKEASERPGRTQRLADRTAQGIVYMVILASIVTFILTRDLIAVVSVILVAGACGVAAGTPLAILAVTAKQARLGVIIKGGEAVENLAAMDTIVFDKTGTLTLGEPVVESVSSLNGEQPEAVMRLARAVEIGSDHPIARAINRATEAYPENGEERAEEVTYLAGQGLSGRLRNKGGEIYVGTISLMEEHGIAVPEVVGERIKKSGEAGKIPVLVAYDGHAQGLILISDRLRGEAEGAIARLKSKNIHVIMLTGDQAGPAHEVGERLGIRDVRANLFPEDKVRIVRELRAQGRKVCMVGDGINDAPSLLEADVGVAVAAGSEVAIESADVLLMTNDLHRLVDAFEASKRAQNVIMFNFGGTLTVDFIGIILASFGLLGPILAAIVHVGSELAFILNSARLFGGSRKTG